MSILRRLVKSVMQIKQHFWYDYFTNSDIIHFDMKFKGQKVSIKLSIGEEKQSCTVIMLAVTIQNCNTFGNFVFCISILNFEMYSCHADTFECIKNWSSKSFRNLLIHLLWISQKIKLWNSYNGTDTQIFTKISAPTGIKFIKFLI